MTFSTIKLWVVALLFLSGGGAAQAQTGLLDQRSADFFSHKGNLLFLGIGTALPLLRDGSSGGNRTLRTLDSVGTSVLLCEGLKRLTREERPDGSGEKNSFPSGHATAAFALATMQAHYHPKEAPLWYLGAFLIADSRVKLRRHRPKDVIAGALLGIGTASWEIAQPRGLVLAPFVRRRARGMEVGLQGRF